MSGKHSVIPDISECIDQAGNQQNVLMKNTSGVILQIRQQDKISDRQRETTVFRHCPERSDNLSGVSEVKIKIQDDYGTDGGKSWNSVWDTMTMGYCGSRI